MGNARNLARLLPDSSGKIALPSQVSGVLPKANAVSGSVLQVVTTPITASISMTTSGFVNISGFAATITPISTNSKILVEVSLGKISNSSGVFNTVAFRLTRNGTPTLVGNQEGSRPPVSFATMSVYPNNDHAMGISWQGTDSPASTSALTYQLQAWAENNGNFVINRSFNSVDEFQPYRTIAYSSITLTEIAG